MSATRVAVDPRAIQRNRTEGTREPVFLVARDGAEEFEPLDGEVLEFPAGARLVYDRDRFTSAVTVWIETPGEVRVAHPSE